MWAPADLFTPVVNAVALTLKRAVTLAWNHIFFVIVAFSVVVALIVAVQQIRGGPRGRG